MTQQKLRFILSFLLALGLTVFSSCGVKGPPLPPISATPAQPEEKSLGRKATPIQPIPSATPTRSHSSVPTGTAEE